MINRESDVDCGTRLFAACLFPPSRRFAPAESSPGKYKPTSVGFPLSAPLIVTSSNNTGLSTIQDASHHPRSRLHFAPRNRPALGGTGCHQEQAHPARPPLRLWCTFTSVLRCSPHVGLSLTLFFAFPPIPSVVPRTSTLMYAHILWAPSRLSSPPSLARSWNCTTKSTTKPTSTVSTRPKRPCTTLWPRTTSRLPSRHKRRSTLTAVVSGLVATCWCLRS